MKATLMVVLLALAACGSVPEAGSADDVSDTGAAMRQAVDDTDAARREAAAVSPAAPAAAAGTN